MKNVESLPGSRGIIVMQPAVDFDDLKTPTEGVFLPSKEFAIYAKRMERWRWWLLGWMAVNSAATILLAFATVLRWS